jgi:hypothetical protein
MKIICAILITACIAFSVSAADAPLIPDGANQILGRICPNMSEAEVEKIVQKYYPETKANPSVWSGQSGYVDYKLTARYSISVAEYNDPKDFNLRFVHADMIIFVFDWELKRRINISFFNWEVEKGNAKGKTYESKPEGDGLNAVP